MPRDRHRDKIRYQDRRSSSCSSESSYDRKKSKSKHKRRSRSRDRSESGNQRRRRSTSRSSRTKSRRRSYSRSLSRERDRHETKSRRRSNSRSRSRRERSRSLSSSRSKSKHHKKKSKRARSSGSRSSSYEIVHTKKLNLDDTEIKVEKAIKAAEAVGLTMTKIPTYEYKEVDIKEDMPTIHDRNLLAELNSDSFVPKSFTSSRNKKQSQNIVIDLNTETVKIPETDIKVQNDDSIINLQEILPEEELKEMWIKKLYHYRKKMVRDEI